MASGSPRTRIDQFYVSKKRKALSPSLKSGRNEKEVKTVEGSPSAKGTLDNYLVTSQDDANNDRSLSFAPDLLAQKDPVKRNLSSEINNYSKDGCNLDILSSQPQAAEAFESTQGGTHGKLSEVGDAAVGGFTADISALVQGVENAEVQGVENAELKKFATDFLSLYCSDLQSREVSCPEIDRKRQASPLSICSSRKKHCVVNQSQLQCENSGTHEKNLEEIQSGVVDKTMPSLKKCGSTPKSFKDKTDCFTPGSLIAKAFHQTPISKLGNSTFSPGESFWQEAIQLADGLCVPIVDSCAQAGEGVGDADIQFHSKNSCNLRNVKCDDKLGETINGGRRRDVIAALGSIGRLKKDLNEKSPLPVKHFDFDEGIVDDSKNMPDRDDKPFESCTSIHNGISIANIANNCSNELEKEMHGQQQMTSIAETERKMDLAQRDEEIFSNDDVKKSTDINDSGESTPSSVMQFRDRLDLNSWLPSEICSVYRKKGIVKLYPWQVDCLQVDGVLQRKNLVYSASTSAGKSFVAEILMLRRVLSSGKMALLVLPYVSICAEKAEHLEVLLEPLGKHVRSYYGNQGGGTLPKDTSIAVCTIEKANSLLNRMLEEGRLSEIGIIVIDELHMVGDRHRGYLLELMLTKLRYASGEGNSEASSGESSGSSSGKADPAHGLQIVGMSATMPNVTAVANWLHAALYQTDFRPVPLEEYIKVGNTIYNKRMEIVRTIPKAADLGGKDPDHVVEMCNEVVQEGHSALIFCSSRKGCESTARHVSRFLKNPKASIKNEGNEIVDVSSAIDALRKCPVGLDPVLEETLPFGVAYHHAGLTVEEREIVETCYRKGLVRVLTATSTLAAGVNLPARRVIFRQPRIGRDFIDGTRYRQMAGRAGRTGIDTKGESVLICKPDEIKRILGLLNESCPPLYSCLSEDMNGMTHAILEVVAGGIVQTANDIHRYVRCTLLNSTKPFQEVVKSAQESLRWLCHKKFLEWNEETKLYSTTPLGRAAFGSSLSPEESLTVLDDLSRAREGFVLASDLHIVYLVTPTNADVEPNWELFYGQFMELSAIDQSVGNRVGVVEPFLMRMAHGAPIHASKRSKENMKSLFGNSGNLPGIMRHTLLSDDQTLRVCKRFYVALILSRLVQEIPVTEVCEAFKVARGMVQTLQENAGRFASMVSVFCERLGWHDLEGLVSKFQNRVSFGVRAEIVELTTIPYVKGSRARALYKTGLRTPLAIAEASIPEIVKALFESSSWAAQEVSAQRHMQVGVAKKIKNGARKIVLEKAEEARIAAFSAFKSLGLDVPQISRQILSKADDDPIEQRAATSSFANDTNGSFVKVGQKGNTDKPYLEGYDHSDKIVLVSGAKLTTLDGVLALPEVNSLGVMKHSFGVDNSIVPLEGCVTYQDQLNPTVEDEKNDDTIHSVQLEKLDDSTILGEGSLDPGVGEGPSRETVSPGCKVNGHEKGPVRAINNPGGFDSFLDLWDTTSEFYFDIHYNRRSEVSSGAPFEIHGIAICWDNSTVYYIDVPKDLFWSGNKKSGCTLLNSYGDTNNTLPPDHCLETVRRRWDRISGIMGKINTKKFTWNLKVQIQVLRSPAVSVQKFGGWKLEWKNMGFKVLDSSFLLLTPTQIKNGIDTSIISWILWPDEERSSNPNLEKEVKKRLSREAAAAANQNGRWKNQMRRAAHNGCCRRVAQTRALCSALWKLLVSEELMDALLNIEIPLVNVLADMELWGIGVDLEGCLQARNLLGKKLRHLEKEAYKLAGITFSLYTTADIAHVLYRHLKLPLPEGHDKGKLHPSTDKQCLDLLRNEHPIVQVIKEHRKLAKLLNCTLGSICSLARLSVKTQKYTLHGHWLQTSTATGRLSMEEPNLQCVEHMVDFKISKGKDGNDDTDAEYYKVYARDYFVPTQDNWLLLTADYSQIELRLMAHFSRDSSLIELLSDPHGDVFSIIAARWTGHPEDSVCSNERDQTKRLVYGILYGMGRNTLAEQLDCTSDEAAEKIQSFKSSFPGVASWLHEAVAICHKKGYVETLKGRKRFLSKIKFGNSKEKSKAQRQAVNSICQGSAADIIKVAMINIYSVIVEGMDMPDSTISLAKKFPMLKGRCRILLQVHDELVLEVDQSVVKEAALLLKMGMENAASLLVPLNVKLKVGKTWGSLEPFQADQHRDKEFESDS